MKVKLLLLCCITASTALGGDPPANYNSTRTIQPMPLNGASGWRPLLSPNAQSSVRPIPLGNNSIVVLYSPLIEGFRPGPRTPDMTWSQKILRLPVVRLVVPQPMERPPGTGKYFAWRDENRTEPWVVATEHPDLVKGPGQQ